MKKQNMISDALLVGKNPSLGLFSGIHGDEWEIVLSVQKNVEKYRDQLGQFLFIPHCSPSAVRRKTRENQQGFDLNRCFLKEPICDEAKAIVDCIRTYSFDLCVDFHEDTEVNGVYIYDNVNVEGSKELSYFREQIRKIAPLYSGIDDTSDKKLGRQVREGYRVSLPPQKDVSGHDMYEGFLDYWALIEGKTKRWMTLEVPSTLTINQKDAVVDAFFRAFLLQYANDAFSK